MRQLCAALYLEVVLKNIKTWRSGDSENENNPVKRKKLKKKSSITHVPNRARGFNNVKLTDEEIYSLIDFTLTKPNEKVKIFLKR